MAEETIFTKIINGDIPANKVFEDDDCICIHDVSPQAPVHLLVIPRKPIPRLVDASLEDKALLGHLMLKIGDIVRDLGIDDAFRVIINNGANAGQTVFHLHFHIVAGKNFAEHKMVG